MRLRVSIRKFTNCFASGLRGFVFGWKNPYDFDWVYPLNALEWRLGYLQKALDEDPWHENSDQYAMEIRRFLILLDDFKNAYDRVPVLPEAERWRETLPWDRAAEPLTEIDREAGHRWLDNVRRFEESTWDEAFNLLRDRLRYWWC